MMVVARRFGFTQIMGPKVEIDRVNKTIISLNEATINFIDSEAPERALFVRL